MIGARIYRDCTHRFLKQATHRCLVFVVNACAFDHRQNECIQERARKGDCPYVELIFPLLSLRSLLSVLLESSTHMQSVNKSDSRSSSLLYDCLLSRSAWERFLRMKPSSALTSTSSSRRPSFCDDSSRYDVLIRCSSDNIVDTLDDAPWSSGPRLPERWNT